MKKSILISETLHEKLKFFSLKNKITLLDAANKAIEIYIDSSKNPKDVKRPKPKENGLDPSLDKLLDLISNETGELKELIIHRAMLEFTQNYFESKK